MFVQGVRHPTSRILPDPLVKEQVLSTLKGWSGFGEFYYMEPTAENYNRVIHDAAAEFVGPKPMIPEILLDEFYNWFTSKYYVHSESLDWVKVLQRMDKGASAGLPFVGDKNSVLCAMMNKYGDEWMATFTHFLDQVDSGDVEWQTLFTLFVKSESRKLNKDPHVIFAIDMISYIVCSKYEMTFDDHICMKARIDTKFPLRCGMRFEYGDWHNFGLSMGLFTTNRIVLDYDRTHWNSQQGCQLHELVRRIRANMYERSNLSPPGLGYQRIAAMKDTSVMWNRYNGKMYNTLSGKKSGDNTTLVDNSLKDLALTMCGLRSVTGMSFDNILNNYRIAIVGDNGTICCRQAQEGWLRRLLKQWSDWGFVSTYLIQPAQLSDFCSQVWVKHPGQYYVPYPSRVNKILFNLCHMEKNQSIVDRYTRLVSVAVKVAVDPRLFSLMKNAHERYLQECPNLRVDVHTSKYVRWMEENDGYSLSARFYAPWFAENRDDTRVILNLSPGKKGCQDDPKEECQEYSTVRSIFHITPQSKMSGAPVPKAEVARRRAQAELDKRIAKVGLANLGGTDRAPRARVAKAFVAEAKKPRSASERRATGSEVVAFRGPKSKSKQPASFGRNLSTPPRSLGSARAHAVPRKASNSGNVLSTAVLTGVDNGSSVVLARPLSSKQLEDINMRNASAFVRSLFSASTTVGARNPDAMSMPSSTIASKIIVPLATFSVAAPVVGSLYTSPAGTYGYLEVCAGPQKAYRVATGLDAVTGQITWGFWVNLPVATTLTANAWLQRCVGVSTYLRSIGKPLEVEGIVYHGQWQGLDTARDTPDEWLAPAYLESDVFQTSQTPVGMAATDFSASTYCTLDYNTLFDGPFSYNLEDVDQTLDPGAGALCYKFYTSDASASIVLQATIDHRYEFIPYFPYKAIWEPTVIPDASVEVAHCLAMVQARLMPASSNRWLDQAVAAEMLGSQLGVQTSEGGLHTSFAGDSYGNTRAVKTLGFWSNLKNFGGKSVDYMRDGIGRAEKVVQQGQQLMRFLGPVSAMLLAAHHRWVADKLSGRVDCGESPLVSGTLGDMGPEYAQKIMAHRLQRPGAYSKLRIEIPENKGEEMEPGTAPSTPEIVDSPTTARVKALAREMGVVVNARVPYPR